MFTTLQPVASHADAQDSLKMKLESILSQMTGCKRGQTLVELRRLQ
jgi:hypothetical protein